MEDKIHSLCQTFTILFGVWVQVKWTVFRSELDKWSRHFLKVNRERQVYQLKITVCYSRLFSMIESGQRVCGALTPWRDCIINRHDKPSYTGNIAVVDLLLANNWTRNFIPDHGDVSVWQYNLKSRATCQHPITSLNHQRWRWRGAAHIGDMLSELSCWCRSHSYQSTRQQQPVLALQAAAVQHFSFLTSVPTSDSVTCVFFLLPSVGSWQLPAELLLVLPHKYYQMTLRIGGAAKKTPA